MAITFKDIYVPLDEGADTFEKDLRKLIVERFNKNGVELLTSDVHLIIHPASKGVINIEIGAPRIICNGG